MDEKEITVGLSTLVKLNKEIAQNSADIKELKKKAPAKKAPIRKK